MSKKYDWHSSCETETILKKMSAKKCLGDWALEKKKDMACCPYPKETTHDMTTGIGVDKFKLI